MKDECVGMPIIEFVGLRQKYSILMADGLEVCMSKSTKKCVVKKYIHHKEYKETFLKNKVFSHGHVKPWTPHHRHACEQELSVAAAHQEVSHKWRHHDSSIWLQMYFICGRASWPARWAGSVPHPPSWRFCVGSYDLALFAHKGNKKYDWSTPWCSVHPLLRGKWLYHACHHASASLPWIETQDKLTAAVATWEVGTHRFSQVCMCHFVRALWQ